VPKIYDYNYRAPGVLSKNIVLRVCEDSTTIL